MRVLILRGITTICLPALVVPLAGCGKGEISSSPPSAPAASKAAGEVKDKTTTEKPPVQVVKPDFTLTPDEFFKECKSADNGEKKFKGKVIELSGTVGDIDRLIDRKGVHPYLELAVKGETFGVQCFTEDKEPWQKFAKGQTIKIQGQWRGTSLVDCVVVEAGPNPAVTITAEALAKECGANPDATGEKYKFKPMILTGEVVDNTATDGAATVVELKGDGKTRVTCNFSPGPNQDDAKALKRGDKVRIMATFYTPSKERVWLALGMVLGPAK